MALISLLGDRLTGVLACVVLATFRWWLGLALLVMWLLVRRPLGTRVRFQATRARQASAPLRRSWYLLGLAWRPHAAKEMRVFGLGEWTADRHREEWLRGMEPTWRELRRLSQQVWFAGALVLAGYALAAGVLGWEADHDQISLRTLATMLMMLPATMSAGSITLADISLAQMLAALPGPRRAHELAAPPARLDREAPSRTPAAAAARPPGCRATTSASSASASPIPGRGEPVLRDLDLELPFGHSLGLVGVNGAGKTTLVTLLARMREPTGGAITVDGFPLTRLNERAWQRQVAVVYQDFARFPFSAAENVGLFARWPAGPRRAGASGGPRRGHGDHRPASPWLGHRALAPLRGGRGVIGWAVAADRAGAGAVRRAEGSPRARARRADRPARRPRRGRVLRPLPRVDGRCHQHRDLTPVRERAPRTPDRGAGRRARSPSSARTRSCSPPAAPMPRCFASRRSDSRRRPHPPTRHDSTCAVWPACSSAPASGPRGGRRSRAWS